MENGGWKRIEEVKIPPVEKEGFQEEIIIRAYVPPVMKVREKREEKTVLRDDYRGENPTVFLQDRFLLTAKIRRKNTEEEVCVDKDYFIIGKSHEADYIVRNNPTISRKHAAIMKREDGYYLEDLGSSNYTYIDGTKVGSPVKLTDGMSFQLSDELFIFSLVQGGTE